MVMVKDNILLAMFDIKPVGKSAVLLFSQIKKEIDLHIKTKTIAAIKKNKTPIEKAPEILGGDYWEELVAKLPQRPDFPFNYGKSKLSREEILKELEATINKQIDLNAELVSIGGEIHETKVLPKETQILSTYEVAGDASKVEGISAYVDPDIVEEDFAEVQPGEVGGQPELVSFWKNYESEQPKEIHSPASREIDVWLNNLKNNQHSRPSLPREYIRPVQPLRIKPKWQSWFRFNRKAMMWLIGFGFLSISSWMLVGNKGIAAKQNVIQNGSNAVANFENAKNEIDNFNFMDAANSFALAYDDLNKASGTLHQLGASFLSVFGDLPGLNKVKSANNLVEAGQSLSKAGENLSLAFATIYETNLLSFLDVDGGEAATSPSLSNILSEFKDILTFADKNIKKAGQLMTDIDVAVLPDDKQALFLDFKKQIPTFQSYIGDALNYSDFLFNFVGGSGPKTYIILLQNNSELRPTGGFPGSYALISFENGSLKKIFVEDIYLADAGLKTNIIPPIPLQHITPNWGMRDANWFADFPTSARKVIELYQLGGGVKVDGVLTINPDIIAKVFDIIGPIEMPEYGLTLGADNFLAEIQNEVEYEADRAAPKQILTDLQPRFFQKLAEQDKNHWVSIFKVLSDAIEQKHILAYFNDSKLEDVAIQNGLGGEIKNSEEDYLQVVFSNVKGSKTDFVTENSMNLDVKFVDKTSLEHTLKISRSHHGGDSKYGFYNRDNSAYVKVYVPTGSVLQSIGGQSITDFRSLIGHEDFGFKSDPDLQKIESTITRPFAGVDVFEETGRTVFGFWLITKPKQDKSVVLKYSVPARMSGGDKYSLLWQKQAGTGRDRAGLKLSIPDSLTLISHSPDLQPVGDNIVMDSDLSIDHLIDITFKQ